MLGIGVGLGVLWARAATADDRHDHLTPSISPLEGLTHLARGVPRTDVLDHACERASCRGTYVKHYFYPARAGEVVQLHVEGSTGPRYTMSALTMSLPRCHGAVESGKVSTCGWDRPMAEDTEVYIHFEADRPGYQIRLVVEGGGDGAAGRYAPVADRTTASAPPAARRSQIKALRLGALGTYASSSAEGLPSHTGKGMGLRLGYGVSDQAELFLGYDSVRRDEEYDVDGFGLGGRYYLKDRTVPLRPYLEASLWSLDREAPDSTREGDSGTALGAGAGVLFFASPFLSVDGGLFVQSEGYEVAPATTVGLRFGVSGHLGGR